jgi:hypothetical protein
MTGMTSPEIQQLGVNLPQSALEHIKWSHRARASARDARFCMLCRIAGVAGLHVYAQFSVFTHRFRSSR